MKVKFCVLRLIISIVNLVLLFIPGFFIWKIWKPSGQYYGGYTLQSEYPVSFCDVTLGGDSLITFVIMALVLVACIVLPLLWLVKHFEVNKIAHIILSVAPAAIVFVFYYMLTESTDMRYSYTAGILYYIFVILEIVNFVATIIGEFSKNEEKVITLENNPKQKFELVSDQLKQYKELLDSGVITQEEFDSKKKQLLGL